MASCYQCGQNGAEYRRTVVKGKSNGTYYGKRTTYSTRTYSGMRTVCEDCAFAIDKARLILNIIGLWIISLALIWLIVKFKF
jgi:hypothetical protein